VVTISFSCVPVYGRYVRECILIGFSFLPRYSREVQGLSRNHAPPFLCDVTLLFKAVFWLLVFCAIEYLPNDYFHSNDSGTMIFIFYQAYISLMQQASLALTQIEWGGLIWTNVSFIVIIVFGSFVHLFQLHFHKIWTTLKMIDLCLNEVDQSVAFYCRGFGSGRLSELVRGFNPSASL